jgi:hypothetical protein
MVLVLSVSEIPQCMKWYQFWNIWQTFRYTPFQVKKLLTSKQPWSHAHHVTRFLSIWVGCTSIQGPGLSSALTKAWCLEVIALHQSKQDIGTHGVTGLDDTIVIGILSSMAPINSRLPYSSNGGLKLVKFKNKMMKSTTMIVTTL